MNSDRCRNAKRRPNQSGSTLVESLVALALFAIGSAAVATLLTQQLHQEASNSTATEAMALAQSELEDIRGMPYTAMASRSTSNTVNGIPYALTTTVAADSPVPNVKTVTTQVTWSDSGQPKTYTVYAIYTDITT